ncbi:MAG: hypothetical protein JWQ76_3205 [Ramlibacter sp.]|nr:hypothetical protein [Ramlibacter sp.]
MSQPRKISNLSGGTPVAAVKTFLRASTAILVRTNVNRTRRGIADEELQPLFASHLLSRLSQGNCRWE